MWHTHREPWFGVELGGASMALAGWGSVEPTLNRAAPQQALANHFYYVSRPHEQGNL